MRRTAPLLLIALAACGEPEPFGSPPDPTRCDEIPDMPVFTGVVTMHDDGSHSLHLSRPATTCEESYGCMGDGADGYGEFIDMELGPDVDALGGYPVDEDRVQVDCGRCIGDDTGNEEGGGGPAIDGSIEVTAFNETTLAGCLLADSADCEPVRFEAVTCD